MTTPNKATVEEMREKIHYLLGFMMGEVTDTQINNFTELVNKLETQAHQQGELVILNKYAKYLTKGIENAENYSNLEILKSLEVDIECLTK